MLENLPQLIELMMFPCSGTGEGVAEADGTSSVSPTLILSFEGL